MPRSKIQQWGNSQGLRLSKEVLNLANLSVGDDVIIVVTTHQIVIKKTKSKKDDLATLVARIPKGYRAQEVDWGAPQGREVW
jgi:antitoxin MazE